MRLTKTGVVSSLSDLLIELSGFVFIGGFVDLTQLAPLDATAVGVMCQDIVSTPGS